MVEEVLSTLIKFKLIELSSQSYQIKFLKKIKELAKNLVFGMQCLVPGQKRIGRIWKLLAEVVKLRLKIRSMMKV